MGGVAFAPTLPDTIVFLTAMKPTGRREEIPLPERHQNFQLLCRDGNRKQLPALGTAPFKYYLTVFGLHTLAEAMGTFSPNFARLICAFTHDADSLRII